MKYITLLGLIAFGIIMSSCEDAAEQDAATSVEIVLQADQGIDCNMDAEVSLHCVDGDGKIQTVIAVSNTAVGHYEAIVPLHYRPADPFIEISLDEKLYRYTSSIADFEDGQHYLFSFMVGADGLTIPEWGASITDWIVVNTEVTVN